MNQHGENCAFLLLAGCMATTYRLCPENCKFKCTLEEFRQRRQASYDRRMSLDYPETAFDVNDLRRRVIVKTKNTEGKNDDLQEH